MTLETDHAENIRDKKVLREAIRRLKQTQDTADSPDLRNILWQHAFFTQANTYLLYHALHDEVSTLSVIDQLKAEGKTILLPRVVSATDMELRQYTGQGDLQKGAYGIWEPTGRLFTDYAEIEIAVVPGMAFDREGHRLGRGKGYYDRLLRNIPQAMKIGVCYPFQLVSHVPTEACDIAMDYVVTTAGDIMQNRYRQ